MTIDDDRAVRLLRDLGGEPSGPSTVDLGRALTDGRRRRRNRRVAGATAIAAVTAVVLAAIPIALESVERRGIDRPEVAASTDPNPPATPDPVRAPTKCVFEKLPAPEGARNVTIQGGDPTGRHFAGTVEGGVGSHPRLQVWTDGRPREIKVAELDPHLADLTSTGTAVGRGGAIWSGDESPWIYQSDKLTVLAGVTQGAATGINEAGTIVGTGSTVPDHEPPIYKPVRWSSAEVPASELPLPAGMVIGSASDIDEDGTVVGTVAKKLDDNNEKPYLWLPDGTHRYLPLPAGAGRGLVTRIRNGWAIGSVLGTPGNPNGSRTSAVWNIRANEVRTIPELTVVAVNRQGWILGMDKDLRGVLSGDGFRLVLPEPPGVPVPPQGGSTAVTLSDDGRTIAGVTVNGGKPNHAALWRCQ